MIYYETFHDTVILLYDCILVVEVEELDRNEET